MAGVWGLYSVRGETRDFNQQDKNVVHLHFFSHTGLSAHHLYGDGFLAKYEKIHAFGQAKSA